MIDHLSQRSILADIFPAHFLDLAAEGREEEFIQPLVDLGYVKGEVVDPDFIELALKMDALRGPGAMALHRAVMEGLALFRQEAVEAGMLPARRMAEDLGEFEDGFVHPGTAEMQLLHRLVSLDGEAGLGSLPKKGDSGLRVRVLQYQLDVYGLLLGEVGRPFGQMEMQQIEKLRDWLGMDLPAGLLPLLADSELLVQRLLDSYVFAQHAPPVAFFRHSFDRKLGIGNGRRAFEKALEESLGPLQTVAYQKLVAANRLLVSRRLLEPDQVADICDSEINRFLLRLVQVRQWTRGFYRGRLDFDFGTLSLESLEEFAEAHGEDVDAWLFKSGKEGAVDYWSLNYVHLFQRMLACDGQANASTVDALMADFEGEIADQDELYKARIMAGVGEHFLEYNMNARRDLRLGRRVYYGTRSLVRSLSKGLKKVMDFIVRGARAVAELAKNLSKLLIRMVREALRVFGRGLGFLFSKRSITTMEGSAVAAFTHFDFDMDALSFFKEEIGPEALQLHLASLEKVVNGLGFALELTGIVLNIAVNVIQGPVGWVKLALALGRKFSQLLRKKRSGKQGARWLAA